MRWKMGKVYREGAPNTHLFKVASLSVLAFTMHLTAPAGTVGKVLGQLNVFKILCRENGKNPQAFIPYLAQSM